MCVHEIVSTCPRLDPPSNKSPSRAMLSSLLLATALLLPPAAKYACTPRRAAARMAVALPDALRDNLRSNGISTLNPLQEASIDAGLRGLDMVVHAQTGSGKTLCFALPLVARIDPAGAPLQGLVLVPTLELAAQTVRVLNALRPGIATALSRDIEEMPSTPVIVGPPAMVSQLLHEAAGGATPAANEDGDSPTARGRGRGSRGAARGGRGARRARSAPRQLPRDLLQSLRVVVLDEADALVMPLSRYATNKQKSVRVRKPKEAATLLSALCKLRAAELQVLAASATVGRPLRRELAALCERPLEVIREDAVALPSESTGDEVTEDPQTPARAVGLPAGLSLGVVTCEADNVINALHEVLQSEGASSPLLFVRTGRSLAREIQLLRQCELDAVALDSAVLVQKDIVPPTDVPASGDSKPLLVATPSGARGLDLHGLDTVVIMGVPPTADAFLHLAGRTGRQGAAGRVVVLTTKDEADQRLPTIGSQLGVDFRTDRRHLDARNERWAEMWTVHEKIVQAKEKGY